MRSLLGLTGLLSVLLLVSPSACLLVSAIAAPAPKPQARPAKVDPDLAYLQSELSRFPSQETCRMWTDFADTHLKWIETRILLFPADRAVWAEYRTQVMYWRDVWWRLSNAIYYANCNRLVEAWEEFDDVRRAVGEQAYYVGFIWPPVAAHMLPRRD